MKYILKTTVGALYKLYYILTSRNKYTKNDIYISLNRNIHSRYLYSLIKSLRIEGVGVALNASSSLIFSILRSQYGKLILKERLVMLRNSKGSTVYKVEMGHNGCSVGLFPEDFVVEKHSSKYSVPMQQHPKMYSLGLWNEKIDLNGERPKNVILFIGNLNEGTYNQQSNESYFKVIPRPRLLEYLSSLPNYMEVSTMSVLDTIRDGTVAVIDSNTLNVPIEEFRRLVSAHRFFLCAPGAFMPLCHNLIEALSVGAIPLIQAEYANLMNPALTDGKNAIVFDDLVDLGRKVTQLFELSEQELSVLSRNASRYYEEYLTPKAIVSSLTSRNITMVKLLAGELSVKLYAERRLK